jgi:hypothetical protein
MFWVRGIVVAANDFERANLNGPVFLLIRVAIAHALELRYGEILDSA